MAGEWSFLAGRLVGDGTIEITETELPLSVNSVDRRLSAPSVITAGITTAVKRLKGNNGRPVFQPGNTVIVAERSGIIRGMGIYRPPRFNGTNWDFQIDGLPSYAVGMPYVGPEQNFIQADPLNLYRFIWTHIQSQPRGNLGLTFDTTTSNVRVGTEKEDVEFETGVGEQVSFESGPRKINEWSTLDLGALIDDYARSTPFDWLETYYWDSDAPHCHIKLGFPEINSRQDHMRLVLGENIAVKPSLTESRNINQVIVWGNGEGRARIRGEAGVADGELRQVEVIEDPKATTVSQANALARERLSMRRGELLVETIEVWDHPNAPVAAIDPGMELELFAETDHATADGYVRVIGKSESPAAGDRATLTVIRPGVT